MYSSKVHIMDHPLVAHKLTIMRDKNTSVKDFRELVSEIGMLITYEATRDLPLTTKHIETPICEMDAPTLAGRKFVVVPILRAGLGLVDGVLRMVPSARVGHIGMYRDEETLEPHPYFCKMPKDVAERDVLIVDPMLATGGSAAEAIGEMKKFGCKHIKLMVLVAAPEGIAHIQKLYPDVDIYAGAVDEKLNENGYIVPGLGDAGDRIFGTKLAFPVHPSEPARCVGSDFSFSSSRMFFLPHQRSVRKASFTDPVAFRARRGAFSSDLSGKELLCTRSRSAKTMRDSASTNFSRSLSVCRRGFFTKPSAQKRSSATASAPSRPSFSRRETFCTASCPRNFSQSRRKTCPFPAGYRTSTFCTRMSTFCSSTRVPG